MTANMLLQLGAFLAVLLLLVKPLGAYMALVFSDEPNRVHRFGGPIERYLAQLGRGTDRLRRRNTGRWRLADFWSVRLRDSGYHFNHYHGSGWLSSACYIELPPLANGQGWLQFGMPCMPTRPALGPDYFVEPEAGQLVLFPSWMWHGTVPFAAKPGASRLTIAFDVLPR